MAIYQFENRFPKVSQSAFIHEPTTLIGDVIIGEECFIGAGAVLRGDYGSIKLGNRTSIQENRVLPARSGEACIVGNDVQVGHGSILHNCEIKDYAVMGPGSKICDYTRVGISTIIWEEAVVTARSEIPESCGSNACETDQGCQ